MRLRSFLAFSLSCITILLPMQTYASAQERFKTEESVQNSYKPLILAAC